MTKPTILILAIAYLASILIVGIFGMQVMSFNNVNYIASITLTEQSLEFSQDKESLNVIFVEKEQDGYIEYRVKLNFKSPVTISVNPIVVAKDPTQDPTDRTLSISVHESTAGLVENDGVSTNYTINKKGTATVTFSANDNSGKKMVLKIVAI